MHKLDPALQERLQMTVTALGYEWVGYEWQTAGGKTTFRLYIDKPQGVTLADCTLVSRQIQAVLEVAGAFSLEKVTFEVSSPGIDRPLFALDDYIRFIGQEIKLRLHQPLNDRRHYRGKLLRVMDETIYLDADQTEIKVPFSMIDKAHVIGEIRW